MVQKKIINTENAPAPIGPYSQAVNCGGTLYVSGQIALKDGVMQDASIESETKQVMANLQAILESDGYSFSDVVKASIFVIDMNDFVKVNEVYGSFLSEPFPARETVAVKTLPKNARVEISVIACK